MASLSSQQAPRGDQTCRLANVQGEGHRWLRRGGHLVLRIREEGDVRETGDQIAEAEASGV